jgi:hypothetical protein
MIPRARTIDARGLDHRNSRVISLATRSLGPRRHTAPSGPPSDRPTETIAITRDAMKRAVRIGVPEWVTSETSTVPLTLDTSTRLPARRAAISNRFLRPSPPRRRAPGRGHPGHAKRTRSALACGEDAAIPKAARKVARRDPGQLCRSGRTWRPNDRASTCQETS